MKNWKNVPVLVTGAGGFIGSHLVETLINQGAKVRAFVRYTSSGSIGLLQDLRPDTLKKIEIVFGDIRDSDAILQAIKGREVVFHLGALIAIPYSYIHPNEVAAVNIMGTLNVLEAARRLQTFKVVHTSTSEVYGTALYTPIDELHQLQGQSPYSASKIGADKLAESYHKSFGVNVATLRPFNTYGPRQSARAVIPSLITQAIVSKKIKIGTLESKRDFTFVSDTVNGFLKIAITDNAVGQVVNVGTGKTVSIRELVKTIFNLMGKEIPLEVERTRLRPSESEVWVLKADNKFAKKIMQWVPTVPLEQGLKTTIQWFMEHIGRYNTKKYSI